MKKRRQDGVTDRRWVVIRAVLVFGSPRVSKAANAAHEAVQELLKANGIAITRAVPLKTFSDTTGYILHLSGNGYNVLKKNTVRVRGSAESGAQRTAG